MARTVADLDEKVQVLINEMQNEVPLVDRPYKALGDKIGRASCRERVYVLV